jgi:hypothetical protein
MNTAIARNRFPQFAIAALAALTVASFARTYYLKFLFGLPPLTLAAHLHGLIATTWLALHYTQARLIAAHRVALHKRLGIFTACLGAVLAIHAFHFAVAGVAAGHAPPGRNPLQFLSVPMGTISTFSLFLASASPAKKREWHKRLMFLASLSPHPARSGRLDSLIMVPLGYARSSASG